MSSQTGRQRVGKPALVPSVYTEVQLRQYLHKIRYPGFEEAWEDISLPEPTLATLSLIQIHCLTTFAFESLALHYEGRSGPEAMSLDPDYLFRRFVSEGYGSGYCFQCNFLLLQMMRALGYRAFAVLGRVFELQAKSYGGLTHMAVLVYLPCHLDRGQHMSYYLADVGFGRSMQRPMLLADKHTEAGIKDVHFIINKLRYTQPSNFVEEDDDQVLDEAARGVVQANTEGLWQIQRIEKGKEPQTGYIFNTTECFPNDCTVSNIAASTSHDPAISPFCNNIIVVKYFFDPSAADDDDWSKSDLYPYPPSRVSMKSLSGTSYKQSDGSALQITSEEERVSVLKQKFGLLSHVSTSEAIRAIQGKPSAIANTH